MSLSLLASVVILAAQTNATQATTKAYALMPPRTIPAARPISWNRSSQSLALFGIAEYPNRTAARRTLQQGGKLPASLDRRLMRYHLDSDVVDDVFTAIPGVSLRQVKWLGASSDVVFGLEDTATVRAGIVIARRGQTAQVLTESAGASLVTIATSATLPILVVCESGRAGTKLTFYTPQGTLPVQGLPAGLRISTVRESSNPSFVELVGVPDATSEQAKTFGINLSTASLVPAESIPRVEASGLEQVFQFEQRPANVPGDERERFDVFAMRGKDEARFLGRNAILKVDSPDGLKTAVWDGYTTTIFEFVEVKGR